MALPNGPAVPPGRRGAARDTGFADRKWQNGQRPRAWLAPGDCIPNPWPLRHPMRLPQNYFLRPSLLRRQTAWPAGGAAGYGTRIHIRQTKALNQPADVLVIPTDAAGMRNQAAFFCNEWRYLADGWLAGNPIPNGNATATIIALNAAAALTALEARSIPSK